MRTLLATAVVLTAAALSTAADTPTAVIEKAITAHGGKDALTKYPAFSADVAGDIELPFGATKFSGQMMAQMPDKHRMIMTMTVGGTDVTIVQLVNGKTVRMTVNGMAQPLTEAIKTEIRSAIDGHEVSMLVPLLDPKKYTLKAGTPVDVDGRPTHAVVVTPKTGKEIALYIDAKTGLIAKYVREAATPDGKTVSEVTVLSEYKKVDGVMTPSKFTVTHDGKPFMTMETSNLKQHEKLDPSEFAADD